MTTNSKYDLDDVTFIIGLRIDSADRLRNVLAVTKWLSRTYTSRVIVGTEDISSLKSLLSSDIEILDCGNTIDLPFHSTRVYNALAREVRTPVMVQLDADVIIPPAQMLEAAQLIRDGMAELVYPYEFFRHVPKESGLDFLSSEITSDTEIGIRSFPRPSVGGCVVRDVAYFMKSGMENERLIGWGPDDKERFTRAQILGGRVSRVAGPLLHLEHAKNPLSNTAHSYGENSRAELTRIQTLSSDELKQEISLWPWTSRPTHTSVTPVVADDLTITIPVRIDSHQRLNNLIACTNALLATTTARIFVGIADPLSLAHTLDSRIEIVPITDSDTASFHRTRLLNEMARMVSTTFIANVDADVVVPIQQWEETMELLRKTSAGLVYPYDGRMVNLSWGHHPWLEQATYSSMPIVNRQLMHENSVGGCAVWRVSDFFRIGMENEKLISWGFDDNDRVSRASKLGVEIRRTNGILYHLDHPRGPDSSPENQSYRDNFAEFQRISSLSAADLTVEISTWPWVSA